MNHRALTLLPAFLAAAVLATAATAAHAEDEGPVVVITSDQPVIVQGAVVAGPAPTVAAAPTTVAAADAADAPQRTHAWKDVNHINGQLVKVGETNDYVKDYRRTNVSTNPIGWIVGSYGVSVSHGINNHVALRGDINYLSGFLDEGSTGFEIGVGAPIYLRRTYQGAFLEPGFISRRFTSDDWDGGRSTSSTMGPQMLVGWHWTWDSGFNVALAGGIGRNWSSDAEYDKVFPNGYLRFGYAF